jgi:protein ImuB
MPAAESAPTGTNRRQAALWLSAEFPHLSLDLVNRGCEPGRERAVAISTTEGQTRRILDCSPTARQAGINPGMALGAAQGLLEGLRVYPYDQRAEQAALQRLADCCYHYSSQVSLPTGYAAVLLEIVGSQHLFGPPEQLAMRLERDLQVLGYHVRTGTAPTPEAARLAARHGLHIAPGGGVGPQIRSLPLDSLALARKQRAALQGMGFRNIGEILRLPRKALSRRLGPAVVDYLDRLTGARPDPRRSWHPPEGFCAAIELPAETHSHQALLFPLQRLVAELCATLRGRDRGVQALRLKLRHGRGSEVLRLGLQQPNRDEKRILLLLRERLECLQLPAPVQQIELVADQLLTFAARQGTLLADSGARDMEEAIGPLLERLQARLGPQAVTGLKGRQDHRPEYSWATRQLHEAADCTAMPHRPVWLFARPQRCRIDDYRLLSGPERIETGWWDGRDCRRDYFVVCDVTGRLLWAFHEHKPDPGWYLQGLFA